jgi:hypothetical protein
MLATPRRRASSTEERLVVPFMLAWLPTTGPLPRPNTLKMAASSLCRDVLVFGCVPVLIFDERGKRVRRVASLDTSVAMRPPFSSRQLASIGVGAAASCMTLSEYITPQSTSPLFDLACTSGLLVVPTSHPEINVYPIPGQLEDVSNRSTIRKLLRIPLKRSYRWTRRDYDQYCRDILYDLLLYLR